MSGIGTCLWDMFHVGPLIVWPSPQSVHLFIEFLVDRTNLGSNFCELVSLSLHCGFYMARGGSHFRFHITTAMSLSYSHPHRLLGVSPTPGLWHTLEIPPLLHPFQQQITIHSPGPLVLSPVSPHPIPKLPIPFSIPFHNQLSPSICLLWLIYYPF